MVKNTLASSLYAFAKTRNLYKRKKIIRFGLMEMSFGKILRPCLDLARHGLIDSNTKKKGEKMKKKQGKERKRKRSKKGETEK